MLRAGNRSRDDEFEEESASSDNTTSKTVEKVCLPLFHPPMVHPLIHPWSTHPSTHQLSSFVLQRRDNKRSSSSDRARRSGVGKLPLLDLVLDVAFGHFPVEAFSSVEKFVLVFQIFELHNMYAFVMRVKYKLGNMSWNRKSAVSIVSPFVVHGFI